MNKEIRKFLKEKKFVTGLPTAVRFINEDGSFSKVEATKGTYVMKYSDVLKLLKIAETTGSEGEGK